MILKSKYFLTITFYANKRYNLKMPEKITKIRRLNCWILLFLYGLRNYHGLLLQQLWLDRYSCIYNQIFLFCLFLVIFLTSSGAAICFFFSLRPLRIPTIPRIPWYISHNSFKRWKSILFSENIIHSFKKRLNVR